jgi:hypothetical protein
VTLLTIPRNQSSPELGKIVLKQLTLGKKSFFVLVKDEIHANRSNVSV